MNNEKRVLKFNKIYHKLTEEALALNYDRFVVIRNVSASKYYPIKKRESDPDHIIYKVYADGEHLYNAIILDKRVVKRFDLTDEMTLADAKMFSRKWRHIRGDNIEKFIYMVFKRVR